MSYFPLVNFVESVERGSTNSTNSTTRFEREAFLKIALIRAENAPIRGPEFGGVGKLPYLCSVKDERTQRVKSGHVIR